MWDAVFLIVDLDLHIGKILEATLEQIDARVTNVLQDVDHLHPLEARSVVTIVRLMEKEEEDSHVLQFKLVFSSGHDEVIALSDGAINDAILGC